MRNRREFMKEAASGALLLGVQARAARVAKPAEASQSKVIVARDPNVLDEFHQPIAERTGVLLDRAIAEYTGIKDPVRGWREIIGKARTVGLKTNGLGGKGISTHAVLVHAIADRLQHAGIAPGSIIIWDRNGRDLQACGFTINTDRSRVRCFGSDLAGYEDAEESFGSVRVRLSNILTRECDVVIGVPILKDHTMAGVTFAMKNMYGVVQRPQELHGGGCCPAVADLNCIPAIRQKVRFTIGDALTSIYDGGPGYRPEHIWYPNALIVGEDRVAVDHSAWQMLDRKRVQAGLKTLSDSGREPRYIAVAADTMHGLGTNDPSRMHLKEI